MSGEKITATLSTLTALAILGAGVVAQPSRTPKAIPAADRAASLESDLRYQLELAYRHDRGAFRDRTAELEHTLDAWRASPKSAADSQLLETWLRESIGLSLPNKLDPLPPTPAFGVEATEPPAVVVAKKVDPKSVRIPPRSKPEQAAAPMAIPDSKPVPHVATPVIAKKATVESTPTESPVEVLSLPIVIDPVATPATIAEPSPKVTEPVAPPAPVSVNLSELNARIGGYHDGLDEIVAAIVAAGDDPSLDLATRLTRQIEQLAEQRRFAQLYFDSLTDRERRLVAEPHSMAETIALVETLVSNVNPPAAEDDFLAAAEQADPRGKLLERLQAASE